MRARTALRQLAIYKALYTCSRFLIFACFMMRGRQLRAKRTSSLAPRSTSTRWLEAGVKRKGRATDLSLHHIISERDIIYKLYDTHYILLFLQLYTWSLGHASSLLFTRSDWGSVSHSVEGGRFRKA